MKYIPDRSGLREIGDSPAMSAAMVAAAQTGASYARTVAPDGRYRVDPRKVRGGFREEERAGAAIVNDSPRALADPRQIAALDAAVAAIEGAS